ncbi:hypothetical protein [Vibrio agarivorans]|uniref:DUF83 domain-containing protein n=1 Tax=Vibrio agarivorans TaxID=153622 RepID=A0ABT7Y712_9VIBR|nr:hypothetical protein [Vibrio agarivorans]MDN2483833.1 hypothetical protein [Vibrio agarivorans]
MFPMVLEVFTKLGNNALNYFWPGTELSPDWHLALLIYGSGLLLAVLIVPLFAFKLMRLVFPYPTTQFGFRGKLVYADTQKDRTFYSKEYNIAARPDFIYRLNNGQYAALELKARKTEVLESDVAQLEISIVAARVQYPIKQGAVVLGDNSVYWQPTASLSSAKLIKRNRGEMETIRKVRAGQKMTPKRTHKCVKCPYRRKCWNTL